MRTRFWILAAGAAALTTVAALASGDVRPYPTDAAWGEALFFDPAFSANRTQSCASCHDPSRAFTDGRQTAVGLAVSLGDDAVSLGVRNAPTITYAALAPPFGKGSDGAWRGGQFHDGRACDLAEQAGMPQINPTEMGMPNPAAVVARLAENPRYAATLAARLGPDADPDAAFAAMTGAIAAYERTSTFSTFDSKYDRFLRGEVKLSPEEELGRLLFFSKQFTNCNICHQLHAGQAAPDETFSNYSYRNIGVPPNPAILAQPDRAGYIDHGLAENPAVADPAADGRFKVPTLRNVAVTGPYMHNGVFADLDTVVRFYNHYNARSAAAAINPRTGRSWAAPEVPDTVDLTDLRTGPALDDRRIAALVAFLRTLTDARYEPLLAGK